MSQTPKAWSLGKNLTWNQRELQPKGWDRLSWILKKHHQNALHHHVCVIRKAKSVLAFLVEIICRKKHTGRVWTHLRKESESKIWLMWLAWYIYRGLFLRLELAEFNCSPAELLRLIWIFSHLKKSNIHSAFFPLHLPPISLHLSRNWALVDPWRIYERLALNICKQNILKQFSLTRCNSSAPKPHRYSVSITVFHC